MYTCTYVHSIYVDTILHVLEVTSNKYPGNDDQATTLCLMLMYLPHLQSILLLHDVLQRVSDAAA